MAWSLAPFFIICVHCIVLISAKLKSQVLMEFLSLCLPLKVGQLRFKIAKNGLKISNIGQIHKISTENCHKIGKTWSILAQTSVYNAQKCTLKSAKNDLRIVQNDPKKRNLNKVFPFCRLFGPHKWSSLFLGWAIIS